MTDSNQPLKRGLAKVGRHWKAKRFQEALEEVDRLLGISPGNPALLVMRAQLIQLQDEPAEARSLDDAESDLRVAVAIDEKSPVPLIELSYFLYAVRDDSQASLDYFDRAVDLCRELLREALLGKTKALLELERTSEAFACLAAAHALNRDEGGSTTEDILEQLQDFQRAQ